VAAARATGALLALLALAACAAQRAMRDDVRSMRERLKSVHRDAYRCAPRELAIAETALDFTLGELDQGDMSRAKTHYREAQEYARQAVTLATADACKPKPVAVVQVKDRDGDGIPDDDDACPDMPGPKAWRGCPDSDGDGLPDHEDKCPREPGPRENQGCPWGDRDGDGVKDNVDRCPEVPGPRENEGCPWGDKDGDGVTDNLDRCPNDPGPKENQGCPWPDRDKDGIPDNIDKCPDVPGVPELMGCPRPVYKYVVVEKKQIRIKQKIHFAFGKATIRPVSYPILDEVADVIRQNAKIRVRIEGHTDSRGGLKFNMRLSQRRANAVRGYLIEKGIAPHRLVARGYGPKRPLESNRTNAGRAANRRVEFHILEEEGR
jgi:outer membrane protein OmpA-like peptidoglycan-associated protein